MRILDHSASEEWMVAIVGLTYMVSSMVDQGTRRITVLEGGEEILSKFQDGWNLDKYLLKTLGDGLETLQVIHP